jgi:hypothetical protein
VGPDDDEAQWHSSRRTELGAPYGTLDQRECKQQFSIAYAHAIATAARCKLDNIHPDDERVDLTIRQVASHKMYDSAQIDVQMKCTSQDVLKTDGVHWVLSRDHYDHLRSELVYVPKILVVLLVPKRLDDWLTVSADSMLLQRSAFWVSLRGEPESAHDSKTVVLPNQFNVVQLLEILKRVGDGGTP